MFVPLIPTPLYDFACMRLVLFNRSIGEQTHVVVHIEIEQGTGFPACLVDDEVVEGVMLFNEI